MIKKMIPHCITFGSIVFASLALRGIYDGNVRYVLFLRGSVLCDRADGWVARTLNVTSSRGYYLDALCDAISFGFVPAICFVIVTSGLSGWESLFCLIAGAIHVISGIRRLARFLDISHEYQHSKQKYYLGLPITISGILFPFCILFPSIFSSIPYIYIISAIFIIIMAGFMVSTYKIPKI